MINGNASDSSAGSNKCTCFNNANIAAISVGTNPLMGTKFPPTQAIKSTPFKAGEVVFTWYITTLHIDMQQLLVNHSSAVNQKFATYYCSKEIIQKEKKDNDFIPKPCNIPLTLQPRKIVKQSQGFKWLARACQGNGINHQSVPPSSKKIVFEEH